MLSATELAKEYSEIRDLILANITSLADPALQEVIAKAQEEIYNRAIQRQKKANADAKAVEKSNQAILKQAGVNVLRKAKRKANEQS